MESNGSSAVKLNRLDWAQFVQGGAEGLAQLMNEGYVAGTFPAEERVIELTQQTLGMLTPRNVTDRGSRVDLWDKLDQLKRVRGINPSISEAISAVRDLVNHTNWPSWEFADGVLESVQRCKDALNNVLASTSIYQARQKLENAFIGAIQIEMAVDVVLEGIEIIMAFIVVEGACISASAPAKVQRTMLSEQSRDKKGLTQAMEMALRQFFRSQIHTALSRVY